MVQRGVESSLDAHAVRVARKRVRQLVGERGLTRADREDLEQEILAEVLRRLPWFDPARGKRESFVARVVDNTVADLLARRSATCRDWRRCGGSLDEEVLGADGRHAPVWRTLDQDVCRERRGLGAGEHDARTDLRIDVDEALATLPSELLGTCVALARGTANAASLSTGVPRRTVRSRIERIQAHFERRGLRDYAAPSTPVPPVAPVRNQGGRPAPSIGRSA